MLSLSPHILAACRNRNRNAALFHCLHERRHTAHNRHRRRCSGKPPSPSHPPFRWRGFSSRAANLVTISRCGEAPRLQLHCRNISPAHHSKQRKSLRLTPFHRGSCRALWIGTSLGGSSRGLMDLFPQRQFSSSSNAKPSRFLRYGHSAKSKIHLSELTPRRSADLEDELSTRLNGADDDRLTDPILQKSISRTGLDWIRSVCVPSSTSLLKSSSEDQDSILIDIRPPTLLHPGLDELALNVARLVQEETVSILSRGQMGIFTTEGADGDGGSKILPSEIGITVKFSPRRTERALSRQSIRKERGRALENVAHVVAVYSCKGGVGKSTVAVNLAYALASKAGGQGRVGLVDLDVYGPSLPLLVRPDDPSVRQSPPELGPGMVEPILHRGVRLMSLGYVSPSSGVPGSGPGSGAAVLRGPMAGRVVSQLINGTNWGELDVLILDLPPGTGDVQLEVCQSLQLSGAVAISTPSSLAWADVVKGVRMFGEMGVNTLALVENMAYFVCEGGGRHFPFGRARANENSNKDAEGRHTDSVTDHFLPGSSRVFRLPISPAVHESNESGIPVCCPGNEKVPSNNGNPELETFSELADAVSTDLLRLQHGMSPLDVATNGSLGKGNSVFTVTLDGATSEFDVPFTQLSVDNTHKKFTVRLFSEAGGYQKVISGEDLRICDPRTGEPEKCPPPSSLTEQQMKGPNPNSCGHVRHSQIQTSMVQHHKADNDDASEKWETSLFPAHVVKKGNYGYEVEWADGAKIIYSLLAITKAAGAKSVS